MYNNGVQVCTINVRYVGVCCTKVRAGEARMHARCVVRGCVVVVTRVEDARGVLSVYTRYG